LITQRPGVYLALVVKLEKEEENGSTEHSASKAIACKHSMHDRYTSQTLVFTAGHHRHKQRATQNEQEETYRAIRCWQCDGVVFASCFPAADNISDLAEVHNASGLGWCHHILVSEAEQEALFQHKPAAAPGAQVLPLWLQPARLLCLVPELHLVLTWQLQDMSDTLSASDFQAASQAAECDTGMTQVLMNASNGNMMKTVLEN